jgi:hypothetical protein
LSATSILGRQDHGTRAATELGRYVRLRIDLRRMHFFDADTQRALR